MKTAIVNTFDTRGGAAIATYRIHRAIRNSGVDSRMFVASKDIQDVSVVGRETWIGDGITKIRTTIDNLPLQFYRNRKGVFSAAWLPDRLASSIRQFEPDIIHLFWVTGGMVRVESLKRMNRPIVWTLHDMWPFTGGCHYDDECGKYAEGCGKCPVLGSTRQNDLSSSVLRRKRAAWAGKDIAVVATSKWLYDCAKSSSIFGHCRIELIPNCVDTSKYQVLKSEIGKRLFRLSLQTKTILFSGASAHKDPRKGLLHLFDALNVLGQRGLSANDVQVVLLGIPDDAALPSCPFPIVRIPYLADEYSQIALYTAADVLVAPSVQENLSNTVVEALSCGTPVVAFHVGGMPDLIDAGCTGYLAQPFSAQSLSDGIFSILKQSDARSSEVSEQCRKVALSRYSEDVVARQYMNLYADIVRPGRQY